MINIDLLLLMNSRPRAFGRLKFQRFMIWSFSGLGLLFFVIFLTRLYLSLTKVVAIYEVNNLAFNQSNDPEKAQKIAQKAKETLDCLHQELLIYAFLLSLLCFTIARYGQKTLNRNRYILKLEEELQKV